MDEMMFKKYKRIKDHVEAVQYTEENKQDLIDLGVIHLLLCDFKNEYYVIDQVGEKQPVWKGIYIAIEPRGTGYYRIDEETFKTIYEVN